MIDKHTQLIFAGKARINERTCATVIAHIAAGNPPPAVRLALELARAGLLDVATGTLRNGVSRPSWRRPWMP